MCSSDLDDAEDLVQAACTRALERACTVSHDNNLAGWLRAVVRNLGIDHGRRRRRWLPLDDHDLPCDDAAGAAAGAPPWAALTALDVREALATASAPLREAFELHFFEGLSNVAIGARLNIPVATVATRIHRARAHLRPLLERRLECYDLLSRRRAS